VTSRPNDRFAIATITVAELWPRKAPNVKVFSRECREAIAKVDDSHFSLPGSTGFRLPFEAKCVGGSQENLSLDRQSRVFLLKRAGRGCLARTVEIKIGIQAIIEINVPIVIRVSAGKSGKQTSSDAEQ